MLGLGLWEILIILFVAVVLVNPKDLPKFFRSLGKLYGQWRSFSVSLNRTIKTAMQQEADRTLTPLSAPAQEPKKVEPLDNRKAKPETDVPAGIRHKKGTQL